MRDCGAAQAARVSREKRVRQDTCPACHVAPAETGGHHGGASARTLHLCGELISAPAFAGATEGDGGGGVLLAAKLAVLG